jgi:coatomer protein complex subunit alpha (xenin)
LDYIRTVQFHPNASQFSWILSSSDDQTLRLWDFQKRTCLSVLTGHNHYVMSASFHPTEDLIVSASLDQTVRVWDMTGLRKKQNGEGEAGGFDSVSFSLGPDGGRSGSSGEHGQGGLNVQAELFGTNDVVVKYVLEGHDRGVNWAAFHPTLPLIASAADDRQVKLWRMSDTKAWEVDTLRGHANNVSCCLFHPKQDLVVSDSEDRSIRVWDVSKRVGVQTFRREGDRFWILAAHRNQNLLAAGHDSGMIVFKLERERPASALGPTDKLFYVRGRELFCHDYSRASNGATGVDVPVTSLRRVGQQAQTDGIGSAPRFLSYNQHNPSEGNVLVCSEVDGGCYELVTFSLTSSSGSVTDGKRGSCMGPACFIGRNRFAVLDRSTRQIVVKNLNNETTKRVQPPVLTVDGMFDGGASGRLILRADDRCILFEVQSRRVLNEITAPKMKNIVWSPDGSKCAILCKFGVIIADRQLEQLCCITDTVRIKSGAWDASPTGGTANEIFVYTTLHHVKYCLATGDTGTIRTLDAPIYAQMIVKDQLFCLDREARARVVGIDTTEARFKLALSKKKYGQVMQMVKHSRLCGRAIVAYLQSKGFPEVALHFVREPKTRFRLALACGNIDAAIECALTLEQQSEGGREVWGQLGSEALRQGNHQVVEMSYQRTKDFDRLSFLYLITGDTEKLRKMLKISNMRGDIMGRYHNALFLGNADERVKVLEESGNMPLAYISAKLHGLVEAAERIQIAIETNGGSVEGLLEKVDTADRKAGCLLQPPTPIIKETNWPTKAVEKTTLEDFEAAGDVVEEEVHNNDNIDAGEVWDDGFDDGPKVSALAASMDDLDLGDDDLGDWDDDLDLGDDMADEPEVVVDEMAGVSDMGEGTGFACPEVGRPAAACWSTNSSHAAVHIAAGGTAKAMQLLNRQIAVSDFDVLKSAMVGAYIGSMMSMPGAPGSCSMTVPLLANDASGHPGSESLPRTSLKMKKLVAGIRTGYRQFQGGKFNDAKATFISVLIDIPLVVTDNRNEANEVKEMLEICREYITSIRIKSAISENISNPARCTELSAYFTHCNLQPAHLLLALRSAMGTAFKYKNFISAASFARRLLELPDMSSERNADLRVKATKVLQKSESMARNEHDLNYNESATFKIDCKSFIPIYSGDSAIKCSYCGSEYSDPAMKNQVCLTCTFCTVGVQTIGLVTGS